MLVALAINSICINSSNRYKFKKEINFERESVLSLVYFFSESKCVPAVLLDVSKCSCVFCVLC